MTLRSRIQALIDEVENSRMQLRQIIDTPEERGTMKHRIADDIVSGLRHDFYGQVCEAMLEAEQ